MRRTISAQSWASVPPAPALTATSASPESYRPENSRCSSSSARRCSTAPHLLLELVGQVRILLGQLGQRLQILDVPLELPV